MDGPVGHDAQPSVLLGDRQHPLLPKTESNSHRDDLSELAKAEGVCAQLLNAGDCKEARGRGEKKKVGVLGLEEH